MVFQCILGCNQRSLERLESYLVVARGPNIYTINSSFDEVVAVWPEQPQTRKAGKEDADRANSDAPPGKKRKISHEEQKPNVIRLLGAKDEGYVVAVTAEDKCVRVLCLRSNGKLEQLSERRMPKRPCAIAITPDGTTILVGDKFGDVYALPLIEVAGDDKKGAKTGSTSQNSSAKPFKPAATQLTVHSGKNRKALEAQLQVKEHVKTKEPLRFTHELLLGHVSMLTDLALARVEDGTGKRREYIITADRDEHIRVSRGHPQAHIIEGYCLGHKQLVTKLCLPQSNLLVSAGGEDEIYVWDWLRGRLLNKIDIGTAVRKLQATQVTDSAIDKDGEGDNADDGQIAVSGLWEVLDGTQNKEVMIACEGVPAILHIPVNQLCNRENPKFNIESLQGNVLDVAVMANTVVAAIDNIHRPWSKSAMQSPDDRPPLLQCLGFEDHLGGGRLSEVGAAASELSEQIDETTDSQFKADKGFWELVYSVENLRKRGGVGDEAP